MEALAVFERTTAGRERAAHSTGDRRAASGVELPRPAIDRAGPRIPPAKENTMKNVNVDEEETSAPKKLTVADLKKIIGGTAHPRGWIETKEDVKVIIQ